MIYVLGANGMLGHMVYNYMRSQGYEVVGTTRKDLDIHTLSYPGFVEQMGTTDIYNAEFVINCIGAIKPRFINCDSMTLAENIYVNSVFPRFLASYTRQCGVKTIHITTDCVFDGKDGGYVETSPHNPLDTYGKSKSLGEPDEDCMVLRTSIIGPEKKGRSYSLLEWIRGNDGNTIKGFTNHWWNGVTTLELARIIMDIIELEMYSEGVFHVFSEDVTKYEMVQSIIKNYGLNISVKKHKANPCSRTLRTKKSFNNIVSPQSFEDMIKDLVRYEKDLQCDDGIWDKAGLY